MLPAAIPTWMAFVYLTEKAYGVTDYKAACQAQVGNAKSCCHGDEPKAAPA